jgi:hypothetical protein
VAGGGKEKALRSSCEICDMTVEVNASVSVGHAQVVVSGEDLWPV